MPSEWVLVLHMLVAAGLAGLLGIERELSDQPAGFRTHMLVGLGAALFAVVSAYGFRGVFGDLPEGVDVRVDPSRVAAQIVTGIGFLGGGAILKYGATVRGLTTAASLWVVAAVGTAAGLGMLAIASAATGIALVTLALLRPLRALIRRYGVDQAEFLVDTDGHVTSATLTEELRSLGISLRQVRLDAEPDGHTFVMHAVLPKGHRAPDVAAQLSKLPHVLRVDFTT